MILGLDTSASNTGFCVGPPGGPVKTGSLRLPPYREDIGGLLIAFQDWLEDFIVEHQPAMLVFEKPVRPFAQLHLETARKLYGIAGLVELVATRRQLPAREISNTEAKKLCYGSGGLKSAEAKKVAVPRARLWGFDPANHDEADACAVWLVAVKHWHPEEFKGWAERRAASLQTAGDTLL